RHGPHLAMEGLVVPRLLEQSLDPVLVCVKGVELLVEEELAELDADADVRERAKSQDPVRRPDEPADLGILRLDAGHDVANGLVAERQPATLAPRHRNRIVLRRRVSGHGAEPARRSGWPRGRGARRRAAGVWRQRETPPAGRRLEPTRPPQRRAPG